MIAKTETPRKSWVAGPACRGKVAPQAPPDDQLLMEGLRQREQAAFDLLFQRYGRYVAAVVAKVAGASLRPQDVEEIAADVFVRIWEKSGQIRLQNASLKAYLAQIARNQTINALRAAKNSRELELEGNDMAVPSVEDHILQKEEGEILRQVLGGLAPQDREIFLRRYFYLERVSSIAKRLGMQPKAVSARLSRLRQRLQDEIERKGLRK